MLRLLVLLSLFSLIFASVASDSVAVRHNAFTDYILDAQKVIENVVNFLVDKSNICEPDVTLSTDVATLSGLAIIISLSIYLLIYFLGKLFNLPNTATMFQSEIYTLLGNIVLLVLILAIINVMDTLGIFDKARHYIINILIKNAIFQMFLLQINQIAMYYSQIQIPLNFGGTGHWFTSQADFGQAVKLIMSVIGYIMNGTALLTVQYLFKLFLLCFSGKFFLKYLFPIGIFLRSFYVTRAGGNALLGISIAFFIVYPTIVYLMSGVYNQVISIWLAYLENSIISGISSLASWLSLYMLRVLEAKIMLMMEGLTDSVLLNIVVSTSLNVLKGGLTLSMISSFLNIYLNLVFGYGMFVMLFGFILGPLTVYITLIASGEISERLGSKINLAAFTRLI